jgi:hypothetical protein
VLTQVNKNPATAEQLFALTAVSAGATSSSSRMTRMTGRGKRSKRVALAREGEVVARFFNLEAGRPYPTNGISLEQGIQVELAADIGTLLTSGSTPAFSGTSFSLANFPGATPFLSVFDQYKICQIEVWIQDSSSSSSGAISEVASCIDLDDANVPTTFTSVADHQGALVGGGVNGRYHKWKPHVATAVYSGTFTSFSNSPASWIDSASPNVQHYGLKVAAQATAGFSFPYNAVARAVISFRSPGIV